MGRENVISTGNANKRSFSNFSSFGGGNDGKYVNLGLGKVTFVFADNSIEYESLNNVYGANKKGLAFPYDKNLSQIPTVGCSVMLVSAPKDYGDQIISLYGGRQTWYTSIMNSSGNVEGTIVPGSVANWSSSKSISAQQKKDAMLFTKDYLKNKGLSKEASAAIMGNIMKECTFDCTAGCIDVNGKGSVGIIQWNGVGYDISKIPQNDLKGQLDLLFDASFTKPISTFLQEVKNNPAGSNEFGLSASAYFAYYFAWKVEVCSACNEGVSLYKTGKQIVYPNGNAVFVQPYGRSLYAEEFFNRFNDSGDSLAWSGVSISNNSV
jgi:hypothetical protein